MTKPKQHWLERHQKLEKNKGTNTKGAIGEDESINKNVQIIEDSFEPTARDTVVTRFQGNKMQRKCKKLRYLKKLSKELMHRIEKIRQKEEAFARDQQ